MRINLLFSVILLGFAVQTLGALIPHPRLYFTSDDLPRIRQSGFTAEDFLAEKEMTLKYFGGKEVTFALPPQQPGKMEEPPGFDSKSYGHYPYWTSMSKNIQNRMQNLALAYASTGKPEYARRAIDYALALSKWTVWTDLDYGNTTCLDTCHITFGVATVCDACYDAMTAEERRTVRDAIINLGLEPLLRDMETGVEHNLQLLRAAALGTGALAVIDETDKGQAYLDSAKSYFKWYLDSRAVSQNIESMGYLSYGLDTGVIFGDVLNRATGDNSLIAHPYLDQVIRMAIYFQDPKASGQVNFSDTGIANHFANIAKILNSSLDNGYAGWYLNKSKMTFDKGWPGVIYGKPVGKVTSPDAWPTSAVFRPIDWVSLRSGWGENDTMLAFTCGNSKMGHNHRDQNTFVLNHAGEWLITDAGYGSFEGGAKSFYGDNTVGHNSLLVDGEGQDKLGGGKVTSFFTSDVFDYTAGDASGSYDPAKLSKFVRRIAYVKPDYFFIFDEVASEGTPRTFEILLHTDTTGKYLSYDSEVKPGDLRLGDIKIAKENASVSVKPMLPRDWRMELTKYDGAESYGPYLSISTRDKTPAAQFLTLLYPLTVGQKVGGCWAVEHGDGAIAVERSSLDHADMVGFRTGDGKARALWTDFIGQSFMVRTKGNLGVVRFALVDGQLLYLDRAAWAAFYYKRPDTSGQKPAVEASISYSGHRTRPAVASQTLFTSTVNASISVVYGDEITAHVSMKERGDIRFGVPGKPKKVTVDGKTARVRYEEDTELLLLNLRAGEHKVLVKPGD
jgi:hypothetical protein